MTEQKNIKTKICSKKDCELTGIEQSIENFGNRNNVKDKHKSECKLCSKKHSKEYNNRPEIKDYKKEYNKRPENKKRRKELTNTLEAKYKIYKKSALTKDLNFDLSFEEFKSFWQKPCFYCGEQIETIGLDRTNNNVRL